MTKESAVANTSYFRPVRPGFSSNLIPVDFANKTRLPENVISLPEPATKLTIITPEQKLAQIIEFPRLKTEISTVSPKTETDLIKKTQKEEIYNPRKRKGYHDKDGRWILRRRGVKGYRCKMTDHETNPCPTPERCQDPTARSKAAGERKARSSVIVRNINTSPRSQRLNRSRMEQPKTKA